MSEPPVLTELTQEKKDLEQLNLLAILHFVFGGLAIFGIGFLILHHAIMASFINNPDLWKQADTRGFSPGQFFDAFQWFYLFMGAVFAVGMIVNVLSGFCLRRRQSRVFSIVIAGIDCFQFPFGTALGVFTLIVLMRESVKNIYTRNAEALSSLGDRI